MVRVGVSIRHCWKLTIHPNPSDSIMHKFPEVPKNIPVLDKKPKDETPGTIMDLYFAAQDAIPQDRYHHNFSRD